MTTKIRLLFTIPNFKTAGSQNVMMSIVRGLNQQKFECFLAVERFPELIPEDIAVSHRLFLNYSGQVLKDAKSLSKTLKEYQIDILHSWDYKSSIVEVMACRLSSTKYLYTKKNNAWSKRWRLKSILAHSIAYDNPDMLRRFFKPFYLNRKATFIPHGVDLNSFKPLKKSLSHVINMCCIGNIVTNKNQEVLIDALRHLPEQIHLNLYGHEDESYRRELDFLVQKYNLQKRVHIFGFIENDTIPEILSKQDIFVLASKQEGLPVSILEALACGLPVLSSDSGGGASYILENNNGGFIFKTQKDLIDKIKYLIEVSEAYKSMSEKAVLNVRSRFSLEKEINAYKDLYLKLVN